jgi:hypothetical protein
LPVDDLFDVFPVPIETIAKCYFGMEIPAACYKP